MKTEDLRVGLKLEANETGCIPDGAIVTVSEDRHGFYVPCSAGRHYLCPDDNDCEPAFKVIEA